jgi:hypothetical protein
MMRDDPIEWARLCREQAEITPDPRIAGLLVQLAAQCEALAERIGAPAASSDLPNEPDDEAEHPAG